MNKGKSTVSLTYQSVQLSQKNLKFSMSMLSKCETIKKTQYLKGLSTAVPSASAKTCEILFFFCFLGQLHTLGGLIMRILRFLGQLHTLAIVHKDIAINLGQF